MQTLNSALEIGMRVLAILDASFPDECSVDELVLLDHAVVHSADLGGPASLHPDLPTRAGEIFLKRDLVEQGLGLLLQAGLARDAVREGGIKFAASEDAHHFLGLFDAAYMIGVRERAAWAIQRNVQRDSTIDTVVAGWGQDPWRGTIESGNLA